MAVISLKSQREILYQRICKNILSNSKTIVNFAYTLACLLYMIGISSM